MQWLSNIDINFLGKRKYAYIISGLIILAGLISLVVKGGPNYGIDFKGGTLVQVKFPQAVRIDSVRDSMSRIELGDCSIQNFGGDDEVLIRVERMEEQTEQTSKRIEAELQKDFGVENVDIRRVEIVGPQVGKELRTSALLAIAGALVGILIYISIRFEFRFAVAAVLCLAHDVLITVGIFSLTNREFTLTIVAALLTIVGYSLNDTIVVFDRIRDNLGIRTKKSYETIVNSSINQTLSRTILTSTTTLFVVASLLILGGEVIRDFAFALFLGVLVGTYSSIYVASPILVEWQHLFGSSSRKGARSEIANSRIAKQAK